jgi:hypothetical protein
MRHHFLIVVLSVVIACPGPPAARADILQENFNNGIPAERWDVFTNSSAGSPWTLAAPDTAGRLQISKAADSDGSTSSIYAGIRSRFTFDGDFSVFVGFDLITFPFSDGQGWNEAVIRVGRMNSPDPFGDDAFMTLRFTEWNHQLAEGFTNIPPYTVGTIYDETMTGRLGITRSGSTLSAYLDRGSGPVSLGSVSSSLLVGSMNLQILASQAAEQTLGRPHTALDVRFDNVEITADSIVPEPTTLSLLLLGGLAMLRRR